jgi:hypothetical protein
MGEGNMTFSEFVDGVTSFAGGAAKVTGKLLPKVGNWWRAGSEHDAAFRSLSVVDQFVSDLGSKFVTNAQYQAFKSPTNSLAKGQELIEKAGGGLRGYFKALLNYDRQTITDGMKVIGSGATPLGRTYLPSVFTLGSYTYNMAFKPRQ